MAVCQAPAKEFLMEFGFEADLNKVKETVSQSNAKNTHTKTHTIVTMGLLTAIVVVVQALAANIRLGMFSITLVLVPIAVGAALYGWKGGAWLGFVFGLVVMFTDTALFMAINPIGTILTVMLKGILAGLAAGLIYKPLAKKNELMAVIVTGVVVPIVNKGIFLLGCATFFLDTVRSWSADAGFANTAAYMLFGMTGFNFPIELGVNLILSTAIVRIIQLGRKKLNTGV